MYEIWKKKGKNQKTRARKLKSKTMKQITIIKIVDFLLTQILIDLFPGHAFNFCFLKNLKSNWKNILSF